MDDPTSIVWWWNNFGIPGLLIGLHVYLVRILVLWAKPYAEAIAVGHIKVINKVDQALDHTPTREELAGIDRKIDQLHVKSDSHGNLLVQIHERVTEDS